MEKQLQQSNTGRKLFFLSLLLMTSMVGAMAQNVMNVEKTDGSIVSFPIDEVNCVSFSTSQVEPGKFQGPQRVFGQNQLKAYGREGYDRYELSYDSRGFVTKISRVRFSDNRQERWDIAYEGNTITISLYKNNEFRGSGIGTFGSNGYLSQCVSPEGETMDFAYNSEEQLTSISINEGSETLTFTWQGGNLLQSSWGSRPTNISYGSGSNTIENMAGVMEYDDGMGIDMDDWTQFYYIGLIGKGTRQLPLSWTHSGSSHTETGVNQWSLDAQGRAVKLINTQTDTSSSSGSSTQTSQTFFWEW